jgi:hypothetical protein
MVSRAFLTSLLVLVGARLAAADVPTTPGLPTSAAPIVAPPNSPAAVAPPGYQWQLVPTQVPAQPRPLHWYRGTMAAVDAVALGATIVGYSNIEDPTYESWKLAPGAVLFVLGGPLVHLLHHDAIGAAKSAGLRIGLPAMGALLLWAANRCQSECNDGNNDAAWADTGAMLGMAAAVVIDSAFFAHEARVEQPPTWTPVLAPTQDGGMTFGVARVW